MDDRPNILLIVSDEERRNDWLDGAVDLPAHERLRADGLSFDRYFTHASPCSPSRASLYTGRYLAEHGVVDNVAFPTHAALDPAVPTIGSLLAERGYRSSYLGKWHLGHSETPDMEAHGYLDWEGNDVHFMGSANTGRFFDPIIDWLRDRSNGNGASGNSTDGNGTDGNGSNGNGASGNSTDGNGTDGNGSNGNGASGNSTDGNGTDGNGSNGNGASGNSTDGNGTDGNGSNGNGASGNSTDGNGTDGNGSNGNGASGNSTDGNGTDGNGSNGNGASGNSTDGNGTDGNGAGGNGGNDRGTGGAQPRFLTVALVNPHDIMWFPADHPSYQAEHPKFAELLAAVQQMRLGDLPVTPPPEDYPRLFDRLPENFTDDLRTKPEVQRAWRHVRNREHMVGRIDAEDHDTWLRGLDYYAWLHTELDAALGRLLEALDELGVYDDTVIAYTSDHGDACGSHGLRAKLPCVYDEVMGVPLIVKAPGVPAGSRIQALATHVDLAATIAALGGASPADTPTLSGRDLAPVLADPSASVRDFVLFSQDSAQSEILRNSRYALRGFFDGETKYARYYGLGGGVRRDGIPDERGKIFDVDADFDDHDHEWYDTANDPHELVNLANDRGRRNELRAMFQRLLDYEAQELTRTP